MKIMDHSMAHPDVPAPSLLRPLEPALWQTYLGGISAVLLALLFLVAGLWKITDPMGTAVKMTQALLPAALSLPIAIAAGITETFAGVLLIVPRFRRWGAWLSGLMLVAFLLYFAVNYNALKGADCSCFPWLKRAVGPGFFIGDGIMLVMAVIGGWFARKSAGTRPAVLILGAVTVFALASYGFNAVRNMGLQAPASVTVNGQTYSLQSGRILVYFFDPQCSHCWQAAEGMAKLNWKETKLLGVPTATPQYAAQFMNETGMKAEITNDLKPMREVFKFGDAPYGVLLENGRQKAAFPNFDKTEPEKTLRELGAIQ
jgi:uncharacterized membrane protein YphA (DoxX/SURF4 family)